MLAKIAKIREDKGYSQEEVVKILDEYSKVAVDETEPEDEEVQEPEQNENDESQENDTKPVEKAEQYIKVDDVQKMIDGAVKKQVKKQLKMKRGSPPEHREAREGEFPNNNKISKNLFEVRV